MFPVPRAKLSYDDNDDNYDDSDDDDDNDDNDNDGDDDDDCDGDDGDDCDDNDGGYEQVVCFLSPEPSLYGALMPRSTLGNNCALIHPI